MSLFLLGRLLSELKLTTSRNRSIPVPLAASGYISTKVGFVFYVVVSILWVFCECLVSFVILTVGNEEGALTPSMLCALQTVRLRCALCPSGSTATRSPKLAATSGPTSRSANASRNKAALCSHGGSRDGKLTGIICRKSSNRCSSSESLVQHQVRVCLHAAGRRKRRSMFACHLVEIERSLIEWRAALGFRVGT